MRTAFAVPMTALAIIALTGCNDGITRADEPTFVAQCGYNMPAVGDTVFVDGQPAEVAERPLMSAYDEVLVPVVRSGQAVIEHPSCNRVTLV